MIDTSSRRDARSADVDFRTPRDQVAGEAFWQGNRSRCFLTQVFEEGLLLFAGQELVVAGDGAE